MNETDEPLEERVTKIIGDIGDVMDQYLQADVHARCQGCIMVELAMAISILSTAAEQMLHQYDDKYRTSHHETFIKNMLDVTVHGAVIPEVLN